ncbi:MAG: DAK2 domain-containing protein [Dehalococcoidia bacterium]|nr:DAK2 domain-containing protein [Dehalococcoidia bacterium]MDD5494683.1 DAK2 domain-containing protein [Dehalococcoidia bacterium]
MKDANSWNGKDIRDMFAAGSNWMEKSVADINAINVFPVPDGDTGTNMLLTLRSVIEEADRASDTNAGAMTKAMSHGALLGARGNSGVILSQIFRGLARGFDGKSTFNGADWAQAFTQASKTAYEGLSNPVEGTILTVIREAATKAQKVAEKNPDDLIGIIQAAVDEARESVGRTPTLLAALMEAGVVDAGGQGLYILLDGALRFLKGELDDLQYRKPQMVSANITATKTFDMVSSEEEEAYGYCTNFLMEGQNLDPEKIRRKLDGKGQSLVVAGDETAVRVHIHTYDPGGILAYATTLGTLHQIQIQNMDDQHVGFKEMQRQKVLPPEIAVVAVAFGDGMIKVYESLGAVIVKGGQTMNPSVKEILAAVEAVDSQKVILLPNNKNIILTATQIKELTSKEIDVVPTRTLPQGITALLTFNFENSIQENLQAMSEAIKSVKSVEITTAARSTQISGIKIKQGQAIGIIDDSELVAAGDDVNQVLMESLAKAGAESVELITLYYGNNTKQEQADAVAAKIKKDFPDKQIELVNGGQPHYFYIVSLE